ncbi:unnamed protein product (mitochondrion) [Plasmodiophora brassicae]|uniref:Uncharacterized protein n=1 Tax=Plasmodiophora brassicae TaxID=37360 RepID=A0A3P3Y349_PLABS|nr:unnamed protein product [Plasmodiophora brassicae]
MGIQGLLPLLRSITTPVHVSAYAGSVVAIDTYCWLHRGASAQAAAICKGDAGADGYVHFVCGRVQMLIDAGVRPLLVFDGAPLPAKRAQEDCRAERRQRCLSAALELEAAGNAAAAEKMYRSALDVTPLMAKRVIDAVQQRFPAVACVVAPYEADAQLAWLSANGHVAAVISEDSDLLAFGVERVLFKMDGRGHADQVCLAQLGATTDVDLSRWTLEQFRLMCIVSGCDYLASLDGMGIRTAHRLVLAERTLPRVLRRIRMQGRIRVPRDYEDAANRAELTFRHQRVFDLDRDRLAHLQPLPATFDDDTSFLGPDLDPDVARAIAGALIDPVTLQPFETRAQAVMDAGVRSPPALHGPMDSYVIRSSPAVDNPFACPRPRSASNPPPAARPFQSRLVRPERISLARRCGSLPTVSLQAFRTSSSSCSRPASLDKLGHLARRRHSVPIALDPPARREREREAPGDARHALPVAAERVMPGDDLPAAVERDDARSACATAGSSASSSSWTPSVPADLSITALLESKRPLNLVSDALEFYRFRGTVDRAIDDALDRFDR